MQLCDKDEGERGGTCLLTPSQAPRCGSSCAVCACFWLSPERNAYSRAIRLLPKPLLRGDVCDWVQRTESKKSDSKLHLF